MRSARSALAALMLVTVPLAAQQPGAAAPAATTPLPAVGDLAPDFVMRGATRYGVLQDPVRLSDFKGQTVVLAFFVRARTRG